MAEASAIICRENAEIWLAKAGETVLPQLKLSYLASAAAWTERAESLDRTASMRASRASTSPPLVG